MLELFYEVSARWGSKIDKAHSGTVSGFVRIRTGGFT